MDVDMTYVSETDFTKGFSICHIKWQCGNISGWNKNLGKSSENFTTTATEGYYNINTVEWFLSITPPIHVSGTVLFLRIRKVENPTPVIYRFGWVNGNAEVKFNDARCLIASHDSSTGKYKLQPNEPIDDLTVHCWISVPNYKSKCSFTGKGGLSYQQKCITSDLLANYANLFKGALGENADWHSLSDVTLAILDEGGNLQRQFFCHRLVLMARSSVFMRMFSKEWKESRDKAVEIEDIFEKCMEQILRYMYTGQLPDTDLDSDEVKNILYASEKYDLPALKEWCSIQLIIRFGTVRDRIDQLHLAERHGLVQLKAVCMASLATGLAQLDQELWGKFTPALWSELMKEVGKNACNMTEVSLVIVKTT